MPRRPVVLALLLANAALAAGCPPPDFRHNFPKAPTPEATLPDVDVPEPAPGQTAVVLDVVDGPAQATLDDHAVCITPCALSLAQGRYRLHFAREEPPSNDPVIDLRVAKQPFLYRRALSTGSPDNEPLGIAGYVAYTVGGWAFWLGLIGTVANEDRTRDDWTVVASSAAISLLGLLVMDLAAADVRPGSQRVVNLPSDR